MLVGPSTGIGTGSHALGLECKKMRICKPPRYSATEDGEGLLT